MRPVDIEADVKEMDRRKRVEAIMNSQVSFIFLLKYGVNSSLFLLQIFDDHKLIKMYSSN